LELDDSRLDTLAELGAFNLAGRYPDAGVALLSNEEARAQLARAQAVVEWLTRKP